MKFHYISTRHFTSRTRQNIEFLPVQFLPSPLYPLLQRQTNDPSVLVHMAFWSQSLLSELKHSSISANLAMINERYLYLITKTLFRLQVSTVKRVFVTLSRWSQRVMTAKIRFPDSSLAKYFEIINVIYLCSFDHFRHILFCIGKRTTRQCSYT